MKQPIGWKVTFLRKEGYLRLRYLIPIPKAIYIANYADYGIYLLAYMEVGQTLRGYY